MAATPVGYGHLIAKYELQSLPYWVSSYTDTAVKGHQETAPRGGHTVQRFEPSYISGDSVRHHLEFALRYEGVHLEALALLFPKISQDVLASWLSSSPTSRYARRAAFLYEFLTGERLPVEDTPQGNYVDMLHGDKYFVATAIKEKRFRINNNLPGTRAFCPLVRRTPAIGEIEDKDLKAELAEKLAQYDADLLARAASYLYMKETQSSYEIEREKPSSDRLQRFAALLRSTSDDRSPLSEEFFVKLQNLIIDPRFHEGTWRGRQNWVGESSAMYRLPDFVPPSPNDVPDLMEGLMRYANRYLQTEDRFDAVALASAVAFGFVFIHPFMDGNGRIHRFLVHKILSNSGFTPKGFVLPVSAVMLANRGAYQAVLEAFSRPLMQKTTFNVDTPEVPAKGNDAVHFRYFDATAQAEFLYFALNTTIEHDLEHEMKFLISYDRAYRELNEVFDWPKGQLSLFLTFLRQNDGRLSQRRRDSDFKYLSDTEVKRFEEIYAEVFNRQDEAEAPRRTPS